MVLIGVLGESDWMLKFLFPDRSMDLMPAELRRRAMCKKAGMLLVIGLAGEVICLGFSLWESAKLNKEAAGLRSMVNPRIISDRERDKFIRLLNDAPKCPVTVHCGNVNNETKIYAESVRKMMTDAGYTVGDQIVFDLGNNLTTGGNFTGITLICVATNSINTVPRPYMEDMEPASFKRVKDAFGQIGIPVLEAAVQSPRTFSPYLQGRLPPFVFDMKPGDIAIIINNRPWQ